TTGGTAATHAASTPGTSASAAMTACSAFAVTDTAAPPISSAHGYHATRCPLRATTATVATTMIPSTINGHAQACPTAMPEREARSASAVNDSQNAPPAMDTVPTTAVPTAHRRVLTPTPETPAVRLAPTPSEACHSLQAADRAEGMERLRPCGKQSGRSCSLPVRSALH